MQKWDISIVTNFTYSRHQGHKVHFRRYKTRFAGNFLVRVASHIFCILHSLPMYQFHMGWHRWHEAKYSKILTLKISFFVTPNIFVKKFEKKIYSKKFLLKKLKAKEDDLTYVGRFYTV